MPARRRTTCAVWRSLSPQRGQRDGAGTPPWAALRHPRTGATIEILYADRTPETFGRCGAGWFWCSRRRGYSAAGLQSASEITPEAFGTSVEPFEANVITLFR